MLYILGEGLFGFSQRVAAWETWWHNEVGHDDFIVLPFPVNLTRAVDVANLAAFIDWSVFSVVIFDTLARCMVGADENSANDCGVVVDNMVRLLGRAPGGRGCVLGV